MVLATAFYLGHFKKNYVDDDYAKGRKTHVRIMKYVRIIKGKDRAILDMSTGSRADPGL